MRAGLLHAAAAWMPRSVMVTRGPGRRRAVALTFDDGPDDRTRDYLDLFDRLRMRATFFVVGEACRARPHVLAEMIARGHEVAGHGFSHRVFPSLTRQELWRELNDVQASLPPAKQKRVRPPRGAISPRSLALCALAGFQTVRWSLDSDDCRTRNPAELIARVSPSRVRPGEIVLLHEGQSWTLEAMSAIVDGLRSAGYEILTVSELLEAG
jgi:peptidoglycan-N-acetylglucosamine deacetylase